MNKQNNDFIRIIRLLVCQDDSILPEEIDWDSVWTLAQKNHLEVLVCSVVPEEYRSKIQNTCLALISRSVNQDHLLKDIEKALTEAGIHYGLQKGSVLKHDYPKMYMRYMSDIDIYVRPSDRKLIRKTFEDIGGHFTGTESGDEQFVFSGQYGVECHGRLLYRKRSHQIENYAKWDYVNESRNRLTEEGYVLNLIGHVVYDLSKGGPGLRYILDLWIYKNRHKPQPNWEQVWETLKKDGIDNAAKNLMDLAEYLFGNGDESELMKEFAEYVLAGGLYGDPKRIAATEIATSGGRLKAIIHQVFRNRKEYENRYPWLKKYPFLLPVAWIKRIKKTLKEHRIIVDNWIEGIKSTDTDQINRQKVLLKRFGL